MKMFECLNQMFENLSYGSCLTNVLVGVVFCLSLIYWLLTKNYNYFTKNGIRGPRPIVFFGNFLERCLNPVSLIDLKYAKTFGSVYGIFNGTDPVLQISDPQLIKQFMVKDFHLFINRRDLTTEHKYLNLNLFNARGDDWKRMRTIMSPTFTSGRMRKMYGLVRQCLGDYLEHLEELANKGEAMDAKSVNQNLTMDVIACCAFATKTNAQKEPNNPFVVNGKNVLTFSARKMIPAFIFPKFLNKLLGINTNLNEEANEWLFELGRNIVEKRRNQKTNNDFLQLLMDVKSDDTNHNDNQDDLESYHINPGHNNTDLEKIALSSNNNSNHLKKYLTENEIIAQIWLFLLAGFETTATLLAYIAYELALNPESQDKIYSEVMSAVDENREISYEALHQLEYLDAVVSETLRLYPPLVRLEREVIQDFTLGTGDKSVHLFKEQTIEIPVYVIHRSEKYYKNANQFIPERFLPENRHHLIPYTYLPFGTGPRNCIGMRFALMEAKLAVVHIIMRYRLTRCDKTDIPVQYLNLTPLLTAKRLFVGIQKR